MWSSTRDPRKLCLQHLLSFVLIIVHLCVLSVTGAAWCAQGDTPPASTAVASASALTIVINRGIPIVSKDTMPIISGFAEAPVNSAVTVTINGVARTTKIPTSGNWMLKWPASLPQGTYRVSASVTDAAGNTDTSEQVLMISGQGRLPRRPLVAEPEQYPLEGSAEADFKAFTDRWRIVPPPYELNVKGSLLDPYNQNVLKGDFPIYGQDLFLNLSVISDTLSEYRQLPTPSSVSAARPGSFSFFGKSDQFFFNNNVAVSLDLFKGDTAFKPFDWRVKGTFVGNINYLDVRENAVVNPDVRKGTNRTDGIASLQEMFAEFKLADLSPNFDFLSIRGGIQPFNSDFRGFVFTDTNLGVRLFGNYESNRDQFNLAYFNRLEKDTNSGLNTLDRRKQEVWIANFYRQDFLALGYTAQLSIHHMRDPKSFHFDENNFLARPDPVGSFKPHRVKATYFGWTGEGHFGWLNVSHAFYAVRGSDQLNPIAGRRVNIRAYMGALELSYDRDWFRPKVSYFYASGDGDPVDGRAKGFDAIFDNPAFVGGGFSFWNRLGIRLTGTGVSLVNRGSLLPDLRSSKEEGQPNFVNPGIHVVNAGVDLELTPKLKALLNANYLRFDKTGTLELLLFQSPIHREIGWDLSAGIRYRPFLNENVVLLVGYSSFLPGKGFRDIFERGEALFTGFTNLTLRY